MKKKILILIMVVCLGVSCSTVCSAEIYQQDFPTYCQVSGGAWAEVNTSQGVGCLVMVGSYRRDIFGFASRTGYNVINLTNTTISGYIYFRNSTSYYGNPREMQFRFTSFGTLEVYEPHYNYGTSYRWTSLPITKINNTNIAFTDEVADRQNDSYVYSMTEILLIAVVCLLIGQILYFIFVRAWHA